MKLLVGLPSNRDVKGDFAVSLFRLGIHLERKGIPNGHAHVSGDIVSARQIIVDAAQVEENGFTHLLFIDDDMRFNPEAFDYLASRDVDFVGANCLIRKAVVNHIPTATAKSGRVFSAGKTGIEEIEHMGLAFNLIKVEALRKMQHPHFNFAWASVEGSSEQVLLREDHYFCHMLRQSGMKVHVDHDAARHVWHMGSIPLRENFTD